MAGVKTTDFTAKSAVFGVGDVFDVSKRISTSPDVFESQKYTFSELVSEISNAIGFIPLTGTTTPYISGDLRFISDKKLYSDDGSTNLYFEFRTVNGAAVIGYKFTDTPPTLTSEISVGNYIELEANGGEVRAVASDFKTANGYFVTGQASVFSGIVRWYQSTSSYKAELLPNTLTANRLIYLPDANGTIALTSDLSNYLPLSGGTMTGYITLHADPSTSMQPATKNYVDNAIAGLKFKTDVRAATTANVTISAPGTAVFDGVTLSNGDRLLVKNQSTATENGVYIFNGSGSALTRATDSDTGAELANKTVPVNEGTLYADTWFTCTNDSITIGVTNITYSQTAGAGTYTNGAGITLTGNVFSIGTGAISDSMLSSTFLKPANNLSDVSSAATSRVNLGIDKSTTVGNADYTILITDKAVVTSVAFTTARTWTLPTGASAGQEIIVADEFQTVTSTNTLTIAAPSGKKLNGVTNGTETISSAGGWRRFICDGSDNWIYDSGVVRLAATQTLSNKRITKRISTIASSATPTVNTDNCDIARLTALATNITNASTNLTGTPNHGDLFSYEITDNGTARTIAWGTSFSASGVLALPTTTVISTLLRCLFQYNAATSKWEIVGLG